MNGTPHTTPGFSPFQPQSKGRGCRVALVREERRSGGAGEHVLSLFPPGSLQPCNQSVPGGRRRLWRVAPGPCNQAGASGRPEGLQANPGPDEALVFGLA